MTLVLKPKGRGNWAPLRVTFEGKHAGVIDDLLAAKTVTLGGIVWRVIAVKARTDSTRARAHNLEKKHGD